MCQEEPPCCQSYAKDKAAVASLLSRSKPACTRKWLNAPHPCMSLPMAYTWWGGSLSQAIILSLDSFFPIPLPFQELHVLNLETKQK